MKTSEDIIEDVIEREGGYVYNERDRGGHTKYGITLETLSDWRGVQVSIEDVKLLSRIEAVEIYRDRYLTAPGLHLIADAAVRGLVVDMAVNHGPANAVKMLQQAAHVFADGRFGPKTKSAVNRMTPAALYRRLLAVRGRFYGRIISRDHSQAVFASGWLNRLAEFIEDTP